MEKYEDLAAVILAAGEGTRFRSRRPKILHPVCGRPILEHAIATCREAGAARVIAVLGNGADEVRRTIDDADLEVALQEQRLGTGHAVLQTRSLLEKHEGRVLVMYGDHPLFRPESFARLIDCYERESADLALLTGRYPERSDFGRIVRDADGRLERIVEHHDASPEIQALREVNVGVYVLSSALLFDCLSDLGNDNPKGEYYLTDIVERILSDGGRVVTASIDDWDEAHGINSRVDLANAERVMRLRIAERWMLEGVTFEDPEHTYVDASAVIGADTTLGPGVCLRGDTRIGSACRIDAGAVLEGCKVGNDVWIKPGCTIEHSEIGNDCILGPNAHVRPDCRLDEGVRIGNFVEVKNSTLGRGTKADHLSYIGDADLGAGVTFACGAITVNYDGKQKQRSQVGEGAFVGCNANLIAPVVVEPRSYVAAGSTITTQVPSGALAVGRQRQRIIEGWWDRHFGRPDQEEE